MTIVSVALWLSFVGLAAWWFRPHPLRVLAIGVGAIVLWFLAVYAFDSFFGWTA